MSVVAYLAGYFVIYLVLYLVQYQELAISY